MRGFESMPWALFWVGLGGAMGAVLRHLAGDFAARFFSSTYPLATLTVNLLGCFLAGVLLAVWGGALPSSNSRLFLMTGVLGGFTTFSAFTVETLLFMRHESHVVALSYVAFTVVGCIACGLLGYRLFSAPS